MAALAGDQQRQLPWLLIGFSDETYNKLFTFDPDEDLRPETWILDYSYKYLVVEIDAEKEGRGFRSLSLADFEQIFLPYLDTKFMQLMLNFSAGVYKTFKKEIYMKYSNFIPEENLDIKINFDNVLLERI